MSLNDDDELIIATPYDSGIKHETFREGNTKLTAIHKEETGLEETKLSVFLELTGAGSVNERPGVDIVTVLDVNMTGPELNTAKAILHVLIDKLSTTDRLSIVTFSDYSERLCSLRQMSIVSRFEIGKLVDNLVGGKSGKDINWGLETAIQVINDRKYTSGRRVAILVMSDGVQFRDPVNVSFEMIPVYTFGLGEGQISMVLRDIAQNSAGGTFTGVDVDIVSGDLLSITLSQCLANLLTVVVTDFKLTVKRVNSKTEIKKVSVGTYSHLPFTVSEEDVVSLGDLYANETCKVQLDLLLSSVTSKQRSDLLQISYSCRKQGEVFNSTPRLVFVTRVVNTNQQVEASKFQGLFNISNSEKYALPSMAIDMKPGKDLIGAAVGGATDQYNRFFNRRKSDKTESATKPEVLDGGFFNSVKVPKMGNFSKITQYVPTNTNQGKDLIGTVVEGATDKYNQYFNRPKLDTNESLIKPEELDLDQDSSTDDDPMENATNRLTDALESVKMIREILGDYLTQQIGFEEELTESIDPIRASNIKLLGEHIQQVFASIKTIEEILLPKELELQQDSSTDDEAGNDPMENATNRLTDALESVRMIREILGDYLQQQIGFEEELTESIDPIRASNIKALGDHIQQVFDSIEAIEEILMQAETTDSSVTNSEDNSIESVSDRVTEAFESVKTVREILVGYVDHHSQFEGGLSESSDPSRSAKVKELGEHIRCAFDAVQAVEDILQGAQRIPSLVV